MKEVFEKIINYVHSEITRTTSFAEHETLINVKFFVHELEEEYNNGWIPCEERLPEETEQYSTKYDPITLAEVDVEWYTVSDLVNVIVKNYDTDEVFVCDDCTVDGKWANFGSYPFEVLSWQPMPELPEQYKKGE